MLCYDFLCYMSWFPVIFYAMLWFAILWFALLWHTNLYYPILCYAQFGCLLRIHKVSLFYFLSSALFGYIQFYLILFYFFQFYYILFSTSFISKYSLFLFCFELYFFWNIWVFQNFLFELVETSDNYTSYSYQWSCFVLFCIV